MEERIIAADPVEQPQEYTRELVALLGGQDPLDVLGTTAGRVRELTVSVPDEVLYRRPEPQEWSVNEVLAHLFDAEIAFSWRARLILAQDVPPLTGYDQVAFAALPHPDFAEMLASFEAIRVGNLVLLRNTPAERWSRYGVHAERGDTPLRLLVETAAGHDRAHVRQIEQTLDAVR
jgi:hypothetical protein